MWRNAALERHGLCRQLRRHGRTIANRSRRTTPRHWRYAIFVTKYPKDWFAYEWGNHVVMDFGVDGWGIDNFNLVVAHETGHVFGCPDEYAIQRLQLHAARRPLSDCQRQLPALCDQLRAVPDVQQFAGRLRLHAGPSGLERTGRPVAGHDHAEGHLDL